MSKVKYEILKGDKLKKFIDKYMSKWEQDIIKVSCLTYKNKKEYLINNHYLLIEK